jgi:hypothetical protein
MRPPAISLTSNLMVSVKTSSPIPEERLNYFVSDSLMNFRTKAEVVYCVPHISRQFAIGLRFSMPHAIAAHLSDLRAI